MPVMEVTRLRVAPERAAGLQAARAAMVAAFEERPGFVRADLVRLSEEEWLDLIVWESSADFAESRRRGGDSDAVRAFFAQIDAVIASDEGQLWTPVSE
jgi:heme-degrading monooxygenase HmoA